MSAMQAAAPPPEKEQTKEMTQERIDAMVAASAATASVPVDPLVAEAIAKAKAMALSTCQVTNNPAQDAIAKANAMAQANAAKMPGPLSALMGNVRLPGMPLASPALGQAPSLMARPPPLTPMGKRPTLMMPRGAMAKPSMPLKSVIDSIPSTSKASLAATVIPQQQVSLAASINNVNASAMQAATAKTASPGLNGGGAHVLGQTDDGLMALAEAQLAAQTAPAVGQPTPAVTQPSAATVPPLVDDATSAASLDASLTEMSPALAALMGMG